MSLLIYNDLVAATFVIFHQNAVAYSHCVAQRAICVLTIAGPDQMVHYFSP